jgi:hypothetical protein
MSILVDKVRENGWNLSQGVNSSEKVNKQSGFLKGEEFFKYQDACHYLKNISFICRLTIKFNLH